MSLPLEEQTHRSLHQIQTFSLIQHIRDKFPHHSLDIIIESLQNYLQVKKQHVQQKQEKKQPKNIQQEDNQCKTQDISSFYDSMISKTSSQKHKQRRIEQIQRKQQIRFIAESYIESGLNYNNVKDICPTISTKFYRNTVQAVNNNVIKEMERYLRYQCNIQIERLNRDQKRSIRTQLTKIRQWLGKRDVTQLQTFYKFIQKRYQLKKVEISIQEALRLYKTILQIVKSPFVDVLQDQIKTQELQTLLENPASSQKDDPEKTIILLFIHHRNLTKISDLLCEKYGYELKYCKHSIKHQLKKLLKNSVKKLIACVQAYQDKSAKLFFSDSDKCIDLLATSENAIDLKVTLLSFYLQKSLTLIQLRQLTKNTNKFFIRQFKDHGLYNFQDMKVRVKIPKLESQGSKKQEMAVKKLQKIIQSQEIITKNEPSQQNQEIKVKKQQQCQVQQVQQSPIDQLPNDSSNNTETKINNQFEQAIDFLCENFNQNETNLPSQQIFYEEEGQI